MIGILCRLILVFQIITVFVLSILFAVSFSWLLYWILTGRNLYIDMFSISDYIMINLSDIERKYEHKDN